MISPVGPCERSNETQTVQHKPATYSETAIIFLPGTYVVWISLQHPRLIPNVCLQCKEHESLPFGLSPYQHRQQQGHVAATEDGEEHGVNHQQDVGGGQRGEQVDQAAEDQVGFVVVVFVEEIPVRHPARGQLGDGLCDTCKTTNTGEADEGGN